MSELQSTWKSKTLHGKYPTRVSNPDLDTNMAHQQQLAASGSKSETGGFVIATRDQCLLPRSYQASILENYADPAYCFVMQPGKQLTTPFLVALG